MALTTTNLTVIAEADTLQDRLLINANLFFKPARRLWTYRVLPRSYFRQAARAKCHPDVPPKPNDTYSIEMDLIQDKVPSLDIEACGRTSGVARIVGGDVAERATWKFMVALVEKMEDGTHLRCGGSIVHENFIVTAGHCIPERQTHRARLRVVAGEYNLSAVNDPHRRELQIIAFHLHPDYNATMFEKNDIALLKTKTQIIFSEAIGPVCLPPIARRTNFYDEQGLVAGWGKTERTRTSDILKRTWVPIVGDEACWKRLKRQDDFFEGFLCAGGSDGSDSCMGDSGGPLVVLDSRTLRVVQVGIVSFSVTYECGKNVPAVYTRLDRYTGWILETLSA